MKIVRGTIGADFGVRAETDIVGAGGPLPGAGGRRKTAGPGATAPDTIKPARRSRMDPQLRTQMILDAAADYFAEHGFEAQIKDLAKQIGVSEPLIFRYFGTKQNLVEEVYQRVFLERWSRGWEAGLRDRSRPLQGRLEAFYLSYLEAVDDPRWIRVSVYAGLAGHDIIKRYVQTHVNHLLAIITRELGAELQLPERTAEPGDLELAWHLHSTFIYFLVRKHIHRMPVTEDRAALVSRVVENFLAGCRASLTTAKPVPRARRHSTA